MATAKIALPEKLIPVFEGTADVRYAHGGRGSGKCLGRGTLLLRADASLIAVEDVRVGDLLLGPDGKPRTVLGTTRGVGPLYRIDQTTGMSFVVNDAHILVLERSESARKDCGALSAAGNPQRPNGRYGGYDTGNGYSLITAAEYAAKPERFKSQHFGFRRAIVGEDRDLPVDPYLLGLWLGDGSSKAPEITNIDSEIVSYLEAVSRENGWNLTRRQAGEKAPIYYIGSAFQRGGSFVQQLRAAGVLGNKHIPEVYFGASIEQRRALLAGLVDTDGHVANGYIQISQARESLLDDIRRLAHGLGLKSSKRRITPTCNGKRCEAWTTGIGGDIDKLPIRIERKRLAANVRKNKDWRRTRVDLTPIGVGEYFGFELDGDHLFLLADGTVTHNTRSFAKMIAVRGYVYGMSGVSGIMLCARQFMNSLEDSSLEECKRAIEDESFLSAYYEIGDRYIKSRDGRIAFVFTGLDRNIASVKSKGRILVCWVDEAEPVTDEAWTTLIPTLREEGEGWNAELWVTWNPKRKTAPVEKRFRGSRDARVKGVELNWRDNPMFPAKLERDRQRDLEERPEQYDHIWEGGYVTALEGAYYAKHLRRAKDDGRIGFFPADPKMTIRLICDIGGTGARADAFAMWAMQFIGREIRVVDYYEAVGQPLDAHLAWCRLQGYEPSRAQFWLPHDGATQDKVYDVSYESALRKSGYRVTVVPNQGKGAALARVTRARDLFPQVRFHESTTEAGRLALGWYHEKRDEERGIGLGPEHDWSSHASDAFGLGCLIWQEPQEMKPIVYPKSGVI